MTADNLKTVPPEAILNPKEVAWREISTGQYIRGTAEDAKVARKDWESAMFVYPLRKITWKIMEKVDSFSKVVFKSS